MDDEDLSNYTNVHRAFLQAFLSRQTLTLTTAKPLLAAILSADTPERETLPEDISQEDLDNYIHALNSAISPFDFEIRSTFHQTTKERIYALVNTTGDALTQMATLHSAEEIAFVKRVLDAMFETYNTRRAEVMAITSMQAMNLAKDHSRRDSGSTQQQVNGANTSLSKQQAEKVMLSLVKEEWFERSPRDFFSLTPRALMELRGWLIDTYNDQSVDEDEEDEEEQEHQKIKFCQACMEIVTVGRRCPSLLCEARLHRHCVGAMWRAQGGREECPMCKTAWVDAPPVGELASKKSSDRRSTNGTNARRRSNGMTMDGAADDDDDDADAGAD